MKTNFTQMHDYVMMNPHAEFFLVSSEEGAYIISSMMVYKDDKDIEKMYTNNVGQLMLFGHKVYFSREVQSITAVYPVEWKEVFKEVWRKNYESKTD